MQKDLKQLEIAIGPPALHPPNQTYFIDVTREFTIRKVIYQGFLISRITVISKCKMDFRNYPMDIQSCSLVINSCKFLLYHHVMYIYLWSLIGFSRRDHLLQQLCFERQNIKLDTSLRNQSTQNTSVAHFIVRFQGKGNNSISSHPRRVFISFENIRLEFTFNFSDLLLKTGLKCNNLVGP